MRTVSFLALPLVSVYLVSCSNETYDNNEIICDAENIITQANELYFENGHNIFKAAITQSTDKARSGKYSCKTGPDSRYGMTFIDTDFENSTVYEATVWATGILDDSYLVVEGKNDFYTSSNHVISRDGEWSQLHLVSVVPDTFLSPIKIYPWNESNTHTVYFDDLKITKRGYQDFAEELLKEDAVSLSVPDSAINKIRKKRHQAIRHRLSNGKGVLLKDSSDWAEGRIASNDEVLEIKMRLKGDWTDHISTHKWSYRIKVINDQRFKTYSEFSIQNPSTRSYMDEWIFHKILESEGLLAPDYNFRFVAMNDSLLGLYAFEEHFTNNMLERAGLQKGLIMKFDENVMWEARHKYREELNGVFPFLETAKIDVHSKKSVQQNNDLKAQLLIARDLMFDYQYQRKKPKALFDLNKLGKFLALVDICNAYHALVWHNQRWYFNPETQILEPIGYDAYGEYGHNKLPSGIILGQGNSGMTLIDNLLKDNELNIIYINYLKQYSKPDFIDALINKMKPGLDSNLLLIQKENPHYDYDFSMIREKAAEINALLEKNEALEHRKTDVTSDSTSIEICKLNFDAKGYCIPYYGASFVANKIDAERVIISSFHHQPITVVGFGTNAQMVDKLSFRIPVDQSWPPTRYAFTTNSDNTFVYYSVDCRKEVFSAPIDQTGIPYPDYKIRQVN